jgi:VWFA-related protein
MRLLGSRLVLFLLVGLAALRASGQIFQFPDPTGPAHGDIPEHSHSEPADSRNLTFSSRSEYVLVPVIVQDKQHHVSGLAKEDFTILENGKKRPIASVEEVISPTTATPDTAVGPGTSSSTSTTAITKKRPVAIIALDLINTPQKYQAVARRAIIDLLLQTAEHGAMIELVSIRGQQVDVIHDFSDDQQSLIAALRDVHTQLTGSQAAKDSSSEPTMAAALNKTRVSIREKLLAFASEVDREDEIKQEANATGLTLVALQRIAASVASLPGRKALIWLTAGFPFQLDSSSRLSDAATTLPLEHTMQMINQANVAIYPVDVRGLEVLGLEGSEHLPVGAASGPAIQQALSAISTEHSYTISSMIGMAEMTGGKAFYNRNDINTEIGAAIEDGSEYYLLSYPLNKDDRKSGWRSLTVRTKEGYTVSARKGFYVTASTENPELTRGYDIDNALASPLPFTSLPLKAGFVGNQVVSSKGKIVTFQMDVPPGSITADGPTTMLDLELRAVATDIHGKPVGNVAQSIRAKLAPGSIETLQKEGVRYQSSFDLPAGEYTVHFVVRDNATGRTGSVISRLKVG